MELKLKDTVTAEIMKCQRHVKSRNGMLLAQPGDVLILSGLASVAPLMVAAEAMESFFIMDGNEDVDPEKVEQAERAEALVTSAKEHHGAIFEALLTMEEAVEDAMTHSEADEVGPLGEIGLIACDIGTGVVEHIGQIEAILTASENAEKVKDVSASAGMIAKCIHFACAGIKALNIAAEKNKAAPEEKDENDTEKPKTDDAGATGADEDKNAKKGGKSKT